jgi:hypothetical protein
MIRFAHRKTALTREAAVTRLGIDSSSPERLIRTLPFGPDDSTAGCENELQTAVLGEQSDVDLALHIRHSNYFANVIRRASASDSARRAVTELEKFLDHNKSGVWENSWLRFPRALLNQYSNAVFDLDLRSQAGDESSDRHLDVSRFCFTRGGEKHVRVPASYLLKLTLAQAPGAEPLLGYAARVAGEGLYGCFSNDNTSPEITSFWICRSGGPGEKTLGVSVARETAIRYLFVQLLCAFGNRAFFLTETGQVCRIYFSPHPPARQRQLAESISDSFYRELFMSPCLSGWDRGVGERKRATTCTCATGSSP